jgi:hypothetical protein
LYWVRILRTATNRSNFKKPGWKRNLSFTENIYTGFDNSKSERGKSENIFKIVVFFFTVGPTAECAGRCKHGTSFLN